jgi:hypothetical protein
LRAAIGAYAAAIAINLLRGNTRIDCGCLGFGARVPELRWGLVGRNALLLAAVLTALLPVSPPAGMARRRHPARRPRADGADSCRRRHGAAPSPQGDPLVTNAVIAALIALWILVLVLALVVVALLRQVGMLHERLGPVGALMLPGGPEVGQETPAFELEAIDGRAVRIGGPADGRSTLLFFFRRPARCASR